MADYAVMPLTDYQNICDSVRAKTGGTEALKSGDLPSAIEGIKTGIDTSMIKDFRYFCISNRFTYEEIDKMDTSNGTNFSYMFYICNLAKNLPFINTSNGTNFSYMFYMCLGLLEVPLIDTSKGTNFSNMFYSCYGLTEVTSLDTGNGTNFSQMFMNCDALTDVIITANNFSSKNSSKAFYGTDCLTNVRFTGKITINDNNFIMNYSDNLTVESMVNIINAFEDNSSLSTTYTVYFGETNLAKLTDEQKAVATAKNIALA